MKKITFKQLLAKGMLLLFLVSLSSITFAHDQRIRITQKSCIGPCLFNGEQRTLQRTFRVEVWSLAFAPFGCLLKTLTRHDHKIGYKNDKLSFQCGGCPYLTLPPTELVGASTYECPWLLASQTEPSLTEVILKNLRQSINKLTLKGFIFQPIKT